VDQIIVGMADCRIADGGGAVLATFALGSCIGLVIYDPQTKVGGMLHFMLPDSSIDPDRGKANPYMFADTGIPRLLEQVYGRGAVKRRLVVRAAGGAQMMDQENVFEIGKRNYLAMRKILWKSGILLHAEAVGGVRSRTVRLDTATGRMWLLEGGEQRELMAGAPKQGGN
jgi:chemotaxis protein CheD